jgi:hypothetical protein
MLAMLVLYSCENRELPVWTEMHLELRDAVHDVVVHPLGVCPTGRILARLPVAFEDVPGVGRLRHELTGCRRDDEDDERDRR